MFAPFDYSTIALRSVVHSSLRAIATHHPPTLHIPIDPVLFRASRIDMSGKCRGRGRPRYPAHHGYLFSSCCQILAKSVKISSFATLNDEILEDKSNWLTLLIIMSSLTPHYIPLFLPFVLHSESFHYSYERKYSRPVSSEHIRLLLSDG